MWWRRDKVAVAKSHLQAEVNRLKKRNDKLKSDLEEERKKVVQLESNNVILESERDKLIEVAARDLERVKAERAVAQERFGNENS